MKKNILALLMISGTLLFVNNAIVVALDPEAKIDPQEKETASSPEGGVGRGAERASGGSTGIKKTAPISSPEQKAPAPVQPVETQRQEYKAPTAAQPSEAAKEAQVLLVLSGTVEEINELEDKAKHEITVVDDKDKASIIIVSPETKIILEGGKKNGSIRDLQVGYKIKAYCNPKLQEGKFIAEEMRIISKK